MFCHLDILQQLHVRVRTQVAAFDGHFDLLLFRDLQILTPKLTYATNTTNSNTSLR